MSFIKRLPVAYRPPDYHPPGFPGLYWPLPLELQAPIYLYNADDVWRFTLLWTLIFYGAVHVATCTYAVIVQWRNWKVIWIAPVVFTLIGGIEALIAGSITGGLLGAVYSAGYFRMSTWIPLIWGLLNTLVIILSSFAIQGAL